MTQMLGDMDRLFDTLNHETQSKTKEIQDQAAQESERIISKAKQEAGSIRQEILQEAKDQAVRKKTKLRAQKAHQDKKEQLETQEDLLDQVWMRAEEMLHKLVESKDYPEIIHQLTLQGLELLGPGVYKLAADPLGHSLLTGDRLQAWSVEWNNAHEEEVKITKRPQPANTWGGLIMEDQNQARRVDLTMPTRLEYARKEISSQVYMQLQKKHE